MLISRCYLYCKMFNLFRVINEGNSYPLFLFEGFDLIDNFIEQKNDIKIKTPAEFLTGDND